MNRSSLLLAAFATLLPFASSFGAEDNSTPRGWRVIWTTDPATNATVSWNTRSDEGTHRVHLRGEGDERVVACQRSGKYRGSLFDKGFFFHHARLTDLKPDSVYHVTLQSNGQKSREFYFRTAPETDQHLAVIFGGDSRSSRPDRQKVNQMMADLLAANERIIAFMHGGDYVANGTSLEQWAEWMEDHELTTAADGRLLPIIPARGNHDIGVLFDEVFDFPEDDANYYALNLGPEIRIVTLNTETSVLGDQRDWLENELADARKSCRWVVAQYHRAGYAAVKRPSRTIRAWTPLFEEYNVDLVCEADGHVIKRTVPIRDGKHDPTGVVYIGEGGLGVSQRKPDKDRWFLKEPGFASRGHHVQLLDFSKERLLYQSILVDGTVVDEAAFQPRD